jgi:RNA polymerase sigma-54 factor
MAAGIALTQKQNAGMVPEHLLGKSVLKMSAVELQEFVRAQLAENPALALQEEHPCPVCGSELVGEVCAMCGYRVADENTEYADDWHDDGWRLPERADDDPMDTFALVAAPKSLEEYLKEQIRSEFTEDTAEIAEFIVDALDEDGYLHEALIDMANRLGMSVPELEVVLRKVQSLDPPGIAARSLQECLLIQIRQIESDDPHPNPLPQRERECQAPSPSEGEGWGEGHLRFQAESPASDRELAETILRDHWEGIERMRLDKVAQRLEVSREDVERALLFIREKLNPHPAAMFRDPWERLAPRQVSRTAPDIAVRKTDSGLVAEIVDPVTSRLSLDETYSYLYAELSRTKSCSDADKAHIRGCVRDAKCLIEALEFRGSTLARIAEELVRCQAEYFTEGPSALKPLTKKDIAQRLGVHESTVCRATQDKTIQLPSGEVISIEVLFDSALPVKELVRKLATQRLSDGEIAMKLAESGINIARRTVAKYRDQLRVLPVEYRLAA